MATGAAGGRRHDGAHVGSGRGRHGRREQRARHPTRATLSPVTIGLISDGGGSSSIGTAALVEQGAKAAVAYVNDYGGGLEGHKITLYICENQSTPAGGQTCANDMVQHGVVAVVEPFTGQGQTEVPTIVGAGIPYITISGASTAELTSPGAFALEGGFPAYLGAMALSAKQHSFKKVAFLVENVPAAIQGAQALGGMVYKAAGVGFTVIPINPGTADISPQMQSAVSGGANAVGMVGDVTLCSSFLQAYNTLGLKLPKYVLSTCQDPSILNSATLDKALAGSYITTTTKSSKADLALYAAIIKKYAPKVNPNPNVSSNQASGVTPVLTLGAIMKGSTQPVTAAGRQDADARRRRTWSSRCRAASPSPATARPSRCSSRCARRPPPSASSRPASPARSPASRCTTRRRCSRRRLRELVSRLRRVVTRAVLSGGPPS